MRPEVTPPCVPGPRGRPAALGTRLWVFDKTRHDPQAPEAYGATITYDLPIGKQANRAHSAQALSDTLAERGLTTHVQETLS